MSITYGELKKRILLKIDEYDIEAGGTDDEDIIVKMPHAVNEAIRFVFYGKSHNKTWEVKQGTPINALEEYDLKLYGEHRTEDVVFEAGDVYCYYFEVDDNATVTVYTKVTVEDTEPVIDPETGEQAIDPETGEPVTRIVTHEEWSPYEVIEHTNENPYSEYTAYKGLVGVSTITDPETGEETTSISAQSVRIVFGGDFYYKYRNVCLHNVAYKTKDKIPAYTGFHEHEIPKNLYQIVNAYRVKDGKRYNVDYYTEDYKLYLPNIKGTIYLVSKFFPDTVNDDTEDDYTIDIPIDTEYIVVNKAAALLTMEGEYAEFLADEEQGMQMLEGDRGRSGGAKIVRLF